MVRGLISNGTDTVTLVSGFKFIPEDNNIQDLGSPTNRFGKIYLAGQTIDLGGTIISQDVDGSILIQKPNGDLERLTALNFNVGSTSTGTVISQGVDGALWITDQDGNLEDLAVNSIKLGSTSTATGVTISVDVYDNILFTSANGTILNGYTGSAGYIGADGYFGSFGYTGSQGEVGYTGSAGYIGADGYFGSFGYTGSQGPGADQDLNTTSSVTFANILLGTTGTITFGNGSIQVGRAPRMVVDQDFIDAPDYDIFFATLLPGDFYWSVTYSTIMILVDYGGYYSWQDLTVYA
jgi:hypothetical protein